VRQQVLNQLGKHGGFDEDHTYQILVDLLLLQWYNRFGVAFRAIVFLVVTAIVGTKGTNLPRDYPTTVIDRVAYHKPIR
jgi:hypothetical protein